MWDIFCFLVSESALFLGLEITTLEPKKSIFHPQSLLWIFKQASVSLARDLPSTAKEKLNLKHQMHIYQEEGVWKVGLDMSEY